MIFYNLVKIWYIECEGKYYEDNEKIILDRVFAA